MEIITCPQTHYSGTTINIELSRQEAKDLLLSLQTMVLPNNRAISKLAERLELIFQPFD